jgi:hypothetical protein
LPRITCPDGAGEVFVAVAIDRSLIHQRPQAAAAARPSLTPTRLSTYVLRAG